MWRLDGKRVLVGVSGGIAAYKAAELVRALVAAGAEVGVMMTRNAQEFLTPLTLQTLSGNPVATETFSLTQESEIGHIRLADSTDCVIVAPATANVLARMAHGLADDLLTTVLLATRAPVVVAPAMNVHMWENPLVRANLDRLRQAGVRVVEPGAGFLACGYEGKGRLADVEELVATVRAALTPADLAGERVLVTAGPNREAIDPVRFVSNRSTGKMGFAVAAAAARHGAEVTLVAGPVSLPTPPGVRRVDVVTAAEMLAAVEAEIEAAGVLVMTAAVADYRPAEVARDKIKKGKGGLTVEMVRNPDILATLTPRKGSRLFVGFAAETADVLANAARKLADKRLDLMVANDVARADAGFASDDNAVTILDAGGGREEVSLRPKEEVAEAIVARIAALRRPA
jgi:phosphopantothenoylcysteine decarboxylase/phosphopantothenate--cysteine ligase